jgi:ketosteroid isomerase-like protein
MNPRATAVLACALALAAGCSESAPGRARDEILDADKAFSEMSAKQGPQAAFLAYLTSDAKQLSVVPQGADGVKAMFLQLPASATLTWAPSYAEAGESGDLGYTWGRFTLTVPMGRNGAHPLVQMGSYAAVWKRQPGGSWKVVLYDGRRDLQK